MSTTVWWSCASSVAHRLGCKACVPHNCVYGKNSQCTRTSWPGMSQKRSETSAAQPTQWHLMAGFQKSTSASCERTARSEPWRWQAPGRFTLLPWAKGKPLAWNVSVPDTYADSHLADTATTARAAAGKAACNKEAKYRQLANSHIFVPIAIVTAGTWNNRAVELVQELGWLMTAVTEDTRETTYLFQRLSVALQRGNAVSSHSTFTTE